jgi:hypothetical protein
MFRLTTKLRKLIRYAAVLGFVVGCYEFLQIPFQRQVSKSELDKLRNEVVIPDRHLQRIVSRYAFVTSVSGENQQDVEGNGF